MPIRVSILIGLLFLHHHVQAQLLSRLESTLIQSFQRIAAWIISRLESKEEIEDGILDEVARALKFQLKQ